MKLKKRGSSTVLGSYQLFEELHHVWKLLHDFDFQVSLHLYSVVLGALCGKSPTKSYAHYLNKYTSKFQAKWQYFVQ